MWVVWLIYPNENKRRVPVHQEGLLEGDSYYEKGRHVNHFIKCEGQAQRVAERKSKEYCLLSGCQEKVAKLSGLCAVHKELARESLLTEYRRSIGPLSEDPKALQDLIRQALITNVEHNKHKRLSAHRKNMKAKQDAARNG